MQRGFTLIELLMVIAIVAVLVVAAVLALNPTELLRQARDSARFNDLAVLNHALAVYQAQVATTSLAASTTVFVSVPDGSPSCAGLGLGSGYTCAPSSTAQEADGTGWIPINFLGIPGVQAPLSVLPTDPRNTTSSGLYYTFQTGGNGTWKLTAGLESSRYLPEGGDDGGTIPTRIERGSNLALAAPGVSVPGTPLIWLAADAITGLSDGSNVTTWTDGSGNGNNGTGTGLSGAYPTYRTNVLNGLPVVRFVGTSRTYFSLPSLASLTAGEIFLVVKTTADPAVSNGGLYNFGTGCCGIENTHYSYADGTVYDSFGTNSRKTTGNPTPSLAAWRIYDVSSAAGSWISRIDGAVFYSTGSNTVGFPAAPKLGESYTSGTDLTGDIAEMVFYNSVLDASTRASVLSYLQAKYAL